MASEKEKLIDAVVKLIDLTQEDKLKWKPEKPRSSLNRESDSIVDLVYVTNHKNKRLALYERKYKVEEPAHVISSSLTNLFGPPSYPYWESRTILEFVDDKGNPLWTFPHVNGLDDLFNAVKYQTAGVRDFLKDILDDES